jgi:S-adenosylmethionine-diacylglycerol 3-amino-3-carboxypropyl transferase
MSFFKNLNFSSSNEDGETELDALCGTKRILCLTGSGTRPLDMLLSGADEVIALDVNPTQNALLDLKVAAIKSLDHCDFLTFLGLGQLRPSGIYYDQVRNQLSPAMRQYWDRNRRLAGSGVWYAGKWEKLLRWNARMLRLFRGNAIRELMSASSVEEQARIWQRRFNDGALRTTVELIGRQWVWKWVMREPAGNFLPDSREVGERLSSSFEHASRTYLFRTSDFATLILQGSLQADGALPVHLRPENYLLVRERLSRLRIEQGGLSSLKTLAISDIDGFSLSDFGSYVGPEDYAACWRGILDVAAPGAKFCERIFMNDMALPFASIRENRSLSERLTKSDKAIIYQIRAGTIGGGG